LGRIIILRLSFLLPLDGRLYCPASAACETDTTFSTPRWFFAGDSTAATASENAEGRPNLR
jgi:hypothetical protein